MRVEGSKVCRMEEEYVQKMNKQCRGKEGNLFKGRNKNEAGGRERAEERRTNEGKLDRRNAIKE
jgi:hypothetical protein